MRKILSKILYPYYCFSCQKELQDSYLCDICFDKIPFIKEQLCPACEKSSPLGATHTSCQNRTPLKGVFVAMDYKNEVVRKLIQQYKYKFIKSLSPILSSLLIKSLLNQSDIFYIHHLLETQSKIITSVPLHPYKLRQRGFNQSEIIAKNLSNHLNIPYNNLLIRAKNTLAQKDIANIYNRQENIKRAFRINPLLDKRLPVSMIIIVDDITTTLSTLNECAESLAPLHPKQIYAIVLARGI